MMEVYSIVDGLKEDHRYMIKLLYQLEQQIKSMSGLTSQSLNLDVLLEIVDYIKQYPEICHHPVEEKMFEMIQQKPVSFTDHALIEKVIDEHVMLDALAELLEIKIGECLAGRCTQSSLLRTGQMFHQQQLKHIECEQSHIFPLCKQYFNKEDWQKLQSLADEVIARENNLQGYQDMREKIVKGHIVTIK